MSSSLRYGCGLIVFSPIIFSLFFLLSKRPQLVIVMLASAFSFLISILGTSVFWNIQNALARGSNIWILVIFVSVASQEACRYLFVYSYRQTERIIKLSSPYSSEIFPLNDVSSSFAAGIGFGGMHSLMMFGSVLAASNGSGDYFAESCPSIPLIFSISMIAFAFVVLDCVLMCMAFIAEKLQSQQIIMVICALHFVTSVCTLGNLLHNGCSFSIPLVYSTVLISLALLKWMWPLMMRGILKNPTS
mmetsp:Transcript_10345/g.10421  ORF Transcript_10345/g.10421 Transcript_10345/m.10421 type:complete len:246 (-) Transcript_10345:177-914(-)